MTIRKGERGFPLWEMLTMGLLVGILAYVLLDRILWYAEQGEKAAVELTVEHMRAGLRWRQAQAVVRGQSHLDLGPEGANPIQLLQSRPTNYLGSRPFVDISTVEPGHWIYETRSQALYYRPRNVKHLTAHQQNGVTFLKFVLTSGHKPLVNSEHMDIPVEVSLIASPDYHWFD